MVSRSSFNLTQLLGCGPLARTVGLALLGLSFCVAAYALFFGVFIDEGDKLTGAWLVSDGAVLYRDVFTHHLPLTYYWVAGAFALLGPTVLAARLSILFFTMIAFAVLMRTTGRYGLVGMAALGWGALGHLFGGQMAIYNTLAGVSLAVVLGIAYVSLVSPARPSPTALAALGLYAGLTILTDATMALGVAGVLLLLALRVTTRRALPVIGAWLALPLLVWLSYLLLTGSLGAAYDSLVRFNAQVYSRYYDLAPSVWVPSLFRNAAFALNIFKPPFWKLDPYSFGPAFHISEFGRWLFGGFLFRAAVLVTSALLLLRRRWLAAALIYGLAIVTVNRTEAWFRLPPFVLVSILAPALVLSEWLEPSRAKPSAPGQWATRIGVLALVAFIGWPILRGVGSMMQLGERLDYRVSFRDQISQAEHIQGLTATPPAALGVYPGDPILNFLTQIKPIGKVMYLWPWVAEEHQAAVIAALGSEPALVYLNAEGDIWGEPVAVYLADLQAYLESNYVSPERSYYVAPDLAAP